MNNFDLYKCWNNLHALVQTENNGRIFQGFYNARFGALYVSSDPLGNESLYVTLDDATANSFKEPTVSGLCFEILSELNLSNVNKFLRISIAHGYEGIKEAFESFCVSLATRVSNIPNFAEAANEVVKTCHDYSQFFSRKGKTSLDKEKEQGIFAELIILRRLVDEIGDKAIFSWFGPERSRHDFIFTDNSAIEVKSSTKLDRRVIKVSNDVQLINVDGAPLYLAYVKLEKDRGISTLDLINEIIRKLSTESAQISFKEKLLEDCINSADFPEPRNYYVNEISYFFVDDHFPKLTPNYVNAISPRIYDVVYKIDLDGLDVFDGEKIYGHLRA